MKSRVCTNCGYHGHAIPQAKESFLVDAMIWAVFGSIALMTGLIPLLVIPMAWTVYHIAKFNTTQCPKCDNLDMVSVNSRKGKAIMAGENNLVHVWKDDILANNAN